MESELGSDLMIIQIGKLSQSQSVPMRNLRHKCLSFRRRHRSLHYSSGGIHMVHNIERRSLFLHFLEHLHKTEDILCVIEVSGSNILNLYDYRIKFQKVFLCEFDMVGMRSKFGISRHEDNLQIASFTEDIIHISSALSVPAVLGAEASDLTFLQSLIELFL